MELIIKKPILMNVSKGTVVLALSLMFPFLTHLAGFQGGTMLPLYTAILAGAFYCDLPLISLCAFLSPLLNHCLTGMPPMSPLPMLQILTVELMVLSLTASLLKNKGMNLVVKILIPILLARLSSVVFVCLCKDYGVGLWISSFLQGIPGILFNFAVAYLILSKKQQSS